MCSPYQQAIPYGVPFSETTYARESKEYRQRFVDVSNTGMRVRYLEWPTTTGADVEAVLFLHDTGQCAEVWIQVATSLFDRGYSVFALDLRGHGGTSHSHEGRYSLEVMSEDVKGFILEKDLYTRPLAVVGQGIGAAIGLQLAARNPSLVGAVVSIDFSLPCELFRHEEQEILHIAADVARRSDGRAMLSTIAPWWTFWLGQAAKFGSTMECATFLSNPLVNVGPRILSSLVKVSSSIAGSKEEPEMAQNHSSTSQKHDNQHNNDRSDDIRSMLSSLGRPPEVTLVEANSLLKPATASWSSKSALYHDEFEMMQQRMDAMFFFDFDAVSFRRSLKYIKCHFLTIYGGKSPMVSEDSALCLAEWPPDLKTQQTIAIPHGSHKLVPDASADVAKALIDYLEGPAAHCFIDDKVGKVHEHRRPEKLQLRALPEYKNIEEARKALGPRTLPSKDAIEGELRKLRLENGSDPDGADSDEDIAAGREGKSSRQTALAKDPPDYFGFVG